MSDEDFFVFVSLLSAANIMGSAVGLLVAVWLEHLGLNPWTRKESP